jgi:putative colanic acid biosynthesis glycosyltransferase WcaI
VKILLISLNYKPELTGIGKYSGEMAEWLVEQGHDINVITAPPYYPQWKVLNDYNSWAYRSEVLNGVNIWRCPFWVPAKPSGLKRIIHLFSFAFSSFPILLFQMLKRPDLVVVVEPPLFCAPASLFLSYISSSRSWLHIQDFEVDAAFDLGILSSPSLRRLVLKVEGLLMSKFDRVSTISDQMLARLETKGVKSTKQILFPNWVDLEHIYPKDSSTEFREKLGIPSSSVVFLYSGNMGEKQGLEIVIEAAKNLRASSHITFIMCGQGAAYTRLHDMADGFNNIYWLSLQPLEKLNDLLNMADAHLLPQRSDAADLVMPSKLTGMLASGRPVIAMAMEETQIAKVLESSGVVVPPENTDLFVKAIVDLANNAEKRQLLGKNARKYAEEHLGRDAVLSKFEQSLVECVSDN